MNVSTKFEINPLRGEVRNKQKPQKCDSWMNERSNRWTDKPIPIVPLQIDRLVQERRNSSALAMGLHLSCT